MMNQTTGKGQKRWLSRTTILWLLVVVLLLAFGLRIYRLADKSVWFDEGWSTWLARKSLAGIAERTAFDTHPPLYFWLLHLWRQGSGDSEFGLRYLSLAIGVLTAAATYRLGRTVGGRWAGLLAAFFLAISRFSIWWSQEIRMYALAALFATLLLWASIRLWDRGRWSDWALYVLCALAGLASLYLFAFILVVVNLVWLWVWWKAGDRRTTFLRWASAQLVVLLLYAPWLAFALGRIPTWSAATSMTLGVFLQVYWSVLITGIPVDVARLWWLAVPVLLIFVACLVAIFWTGRRNWIVVRNTLLLLLGLLLPAGMVYAISLPREAFFYTPQLSPRYLLLFASSFFVLLAWGLVKLAGIRLPSFGSSETDESGRRGWVLALVLAAIVILVAAYGLWHYYPSRILVDDFKSVVATLRAHQQPGDGVVLYNDEDWPTFVYHYPGEWVGIPNGQRMTPESAAHYLADLWQESDGIWLAGTPSAAINDPLAEVPSWLAERAASITEYRLSDKVLRLYARTKERASTAPALAPGALPMYHTEADLAGFNLVGYDQPLKEYRAGDTIHLFLYWQGGGGGEEFELRLSSGDGQVWKRVSLEAPAQMAGGGIRRQQADVVIPPEAPGGRYTFGLYAPSSGESVAFGRVHIREQESASHVLADVDIAHPHQVDFDDGVRLLGYDLETTTLKPGDSLALTLYWQARQPVEHRYKVFTHILGSSHNPASGTPVWGQQDNEPVSGTRPTSTWQPGEVIVDGYVLTLDPQAPAGDYTLEIGLYDPATGQRLPVLDAEGNAVADHLVIGSLTVTAVP